MDVAELRALTDDELIRRHDALAAEDVGDAAHRSTIYLDEVRARVAEHQLREMVRRILVVLTVLGVLLIATLTAVIAAL